jgi:ClpP class serine protease
MFNFTKLVLILFTSKYSRVSKRTLGLQGGGEQIAIIRASGSITRTRSPLSVPSSGIIAEQLIEKIRTVRGNFFILVTRFIFHTRSVIYFKL